MLIFFGTRASKIKSRQVTGNTECPYCKSQNSFIATTFGRYFHVFWIPFFPLQKTTILECSHCKKSYRAEELPQNIKRSLQENDRLNPPKRPIWHGCGCLIVIALVLILLITSIIGYFTNKDAIDESAADIRREYLKEDIKRTTSEPNEDNDSLSYYLKTCINITLEGIDTDEVKYFTKSNNGKLLILTKVGDMKKIEKSSRKELVFAIEDCLEDYIGLNNYEIYIGVDGNWNMLMVKTPNGSDLGGKYADEKLLLPFYDKDSILNDSILNDSLDLSN